MRLKLDENVDVRAEGVLERAGHDADTVAEEDLGGAADPRVAEAARILVTLDRGFADLRAFPARLSLWRPRPPAASPGPRQRDSGLELLLRYDDSRRSRGAR